MSVNKEVVDRIRSTFLSMASDSPADDYHPKDMDRIRQKDWPIERFVLTTKSEDQALAGLVKAMKWRKSYGVNDFRDDQFPEEMYRMAEYSQFGRDREGRRILWTQMSHHHRCADWNQLLKQFIVYQYELLDRDQDREGGWAVVGDPTGAGLGNVEMDFNNFTVDVLQSYYPKGPKYMLVVDLPWVLTATAKLIMAFMNEHLRQTVKFIKRDELDAYVSPEYIPVHMKGGQYDKPLVQIPEGVRPLDKHEQFTADQIKKIYSTYKSELK
ncbi:motile sperm domain-containing protein 2-like [Oppia nitens]|uniref:motile sperm domain-containing protein 2-like n=1 Tax=Oppia nitens TaxID=1686743 RepID=UPI0023DC2991|nr:motile sperm domain-containing protein 2-like [Oppia nitens]XP_054153384.1 motile sperm domain-containing protein 2-like [Oppia nitens]